ncbi:MAG: DUF2950 domain-containing protein [Candidatus Sumerlaeaceae bacterium]|nr:DUF2950 domain-containing protein [Candidatus Sumerlaeaceae bacterium]
MFSKAAEISHTTQARRGIVAIALAITFAIAEVTAQAGIEKGQSTFDTPVAAAKALADAVKAKNTTAIVEMLGPDAPDLARSGDDVADKARLTDFAKRVAELIAVTTTTADSANIVIGKERWPFPIPLARVDNKWFFDTKAGREEILNRRIGQNELSTIKVMRAFVAAEKEYFEMDPDGDGVKAYAAKLIRDEGKKNGLFWPAAAGEKPSPMGPMVAEAQAEGYSKQGQAYHGYYFKGLKRQGLKAAGGAKSYLVKDQMTGGFALLAYPAEYGDSGIMTFIVNQDGKILEKDLGKNTEAAAKQITEFNPDKGWKSAD